MLSVIDGLWKEHLLAMDHLKEGIGLRGYAQQDPLVAYKKESFDMFEAMMAKFQEDTVRFLFRMQILGPDGQPLDGLRPSRAAPFRPLLPWPAPRSPSQRRCRAARNCHPHPPALHHHRCARKRVPPQEAARTGSRHPRRRRRSRRSPRSAAPAKKSAATIPAPAAPARNTRNATAPKSRPDPATELSLYRFCLVDVRSLHRCCRESDLRIGR